MVGLTLGVSLTSPSLKYFFWLGEGAKRGEAKFLFMDKFLGIRAKELFRGRPNFTTLKKNLFGLGERGGANLTFLFMHGFEWGKGESCLELSPNLKFLERGVT